jgi:hypothetical protein
MAIAEKCFYLEYLGVAYNYNITDKPLVLIAQNSKNLYTLDVQGTTIEGSCLEALFEHQSKTLEWLDITGCHEMGSVEDLIQLRKPPLLEIERDNPDYETDDSESRDEYDDYGDQLGMMFDDEYWSDEFWSDEDPNFREPFIPEESDYWW